MVTSIKHNKRAPDSCNFGMKPPQGRAHQISSKYRTLKIERFHQRLQHKHTGMAYLQRPASFSRSYLVDIYRVSAVRCTVYTYATFDYPTDRYLGVLLVYMRLTLSQLKGFYSLRFSEKFSSIIYLKVWGISACVVQPFILSSYNGKSSVRALSINV